MKLPEIQRRATRRVSVGNMAIGGDAPVSVQSMTTTRTSDAEATVAQVRALAEAGADLVRVAVPSQADTAGLGRIVAGSPVPIVADVHFHFDRALEAIAAGVAKIRLNPGNLRDTGQVRQVIRAAREAGVAIRVGVNEGSVVERAGGQLNREELDRPLVDLMVEKLAEYLELFEAEGFEQLVLSAKSHDAVTCVEVYRRLSQRWVWPLHLGVTHAGTPSTGAIRSAAALGTLLAEGIGDTIRISYAGEPVAEVQAGRELLASLRLRPREGVELIACPTCGRAEVDVAAAAETLRARLADVRAPLRLAVMGCVVNGPGEAEGADVALCAGRDKAVLYVRGQRVGVVPAAEMVAAAEAQVRRLAEECPGSGPRP